MPKKVFVVLRTFPFFRQITKSANTVKINNIYISFQILSKKSICAVGQKRY